MSNSDDKYLLPSRRHVALVQHRLDAVTHAMADKLEDQFLTGGLEYRIAQLRAGLSRPESRLLGLEESLS